MCSAKRLSSEERKKEIMEAAARGFVEKGFSNTTMEDVIGETTMSKGGVYHYYKSTIDILHDLMVSGINYRNEVIKSYMSEYIEDLEIEFMAKRLVEKMIDDNPYMEIYVQFLIEKKRDGKLSKLFEELKSQSREEFYSLLNKRSKYLTDENSYDLITNFLNSMILGSDILKARENFTRNKDILEKMVILILKEGEN